MPRFTVTFRLQTLMLLIASAGRAIALNPIERFATDFIAPRFFQWFANSEAVARLHQDHVDASQVRHMMKGSLLAEAPDAAKLDFAQSPAGVAVANFMRLEQQHIGVWKIEKIVEAAGTGFDADAARKRLELETGSTKVVVFSFVDCPWYGTTVAEKTTTSCTTFASHVTHSYRSCGIT